MHCDKIKELISDYCEGKIAPAMLVPLENHLAQCEACRREVQEMKEVWNILDNAPVAAPPPSLRTQVWNKIDAESEEIRKRPQPSLSDQLRNLFRRPAVIWSGVALLLVLLAGVTIPGKFMPAGFPTPLTFIHMFHSHNANPLTVKVEGITRNTNGGGTSYYLNVQAINSGSMDIPMTFSLNQQGMFLSGNQYVAPAKRDFSFRIPISLAENQNRISVIISWNTNKKSIRQTTSLPVPLN